MEPLGHSCYSDKDKCEDVRCPSPPIQISVSSTLPVSDESVIPSWLQRMRDDEEELKEAMAAIFASGTEYYLDSTDNNDSAMTDTSPSDPDAALDPDPTVRIIKPLPKRDLKSRVPPARVIKALPRRPLKPHIIRLPRQMSEATNLSDSETKALAVERSATPSSLTYIPPSPLSTLISDHDMGGSENLTVSNTVRVIKRLHKGCSLNNPTSEPSVAEANTPSPPAYRPPYPPCSLISGSEDLTIPSTVRVVKPLPKRMMKDCSFNDLETKPPVVEVNTTPSLPTYDPLSNPTPTLTATHTGLSNVVQMRTPAKAEGLTTLLASPLPPPIRPIDNDIESFFVTAPPHTSKTLSMAGASTSMDGLTVPFTSPAALAKPTSSTPSKSLSPVSFHTKNRSRAKLAQTPTDTSEDDEDINALIKRFSKSRAIWVDDNPDPIPAPQPPVPLKTSRVSRPRQIGSTEHNGVATPIPPAHGRSAGNMIVKTTTSAESMRELNHSEQVSQYWNNMSGTSRIYDSNIKNATLINSFQSTYKSTNSNNSFAVDDSSFSDFQHETNDVQCSDSITSISEPNISSDEADLILKQLDGDATMGVVDRQPSQQDDHIPSVEQYDGLHKSTSISVDSQQSPIQVTASSEIDGYVMNWDESDTALPTSIVFPASKDGLLGKQSTIYPVEESTVCGTLVEQADPCLSNTKESNEMNELNEIDKEDTSTAPISANTSLAKSRTPTFSPNLLPRSDGENIFMGNFDKRLHREPLSRQMGSLLLELDSDSEPSVASIPTSQLNTTNDVPILQTPVHPNNPGETPADLNTNYMSEDGSYESLEKVRLGDDLERHTRIHELVVPTGFTAGRFTSTEESEFNPSIRMNDPVPSTVRSQSASVSHSQLPNSVLPSPKEQEQQSTSAFDPIPPEGGPANNIDPSSKREQTATDSNSKLSDTVSGDNSSSSSESTQSVSATFSVSVITITRCKSGTQSPPIHTSPAFLSPSFRPRSPNSPSLLPPAVPHNSDVAPSADVVRPPYIEASTTEAFDVGMPTAVTVSQFNTTHVPPYQDIPIFSDHVTFNTSFVPLAPVAEVYAPFLYEPPDIDMCPDTSPDPSYLPHFHPIANNASSNVPEMWLWGDTQQGPNEDGDRMDLLLDERMTFSRRSDLYEQSHQVDSEMASAGDWCCTEGDVEMTILPEPAVTHEETTMDIDPSGPDVGASLEVPIDTPPTTQTPSLASISPPRRTTGIQYTPVSMTIPPLDLQLLTGDMSAFVQQISAVVKTLDSLASLKFEAQTPQLASAANRQPMVRERVLQNPDFEALAHEPSATELSSGAPDKDEFSSMDGNSVGKESAQSEDIDNHVPSASNPMWSLKKYGRGSLMDDAFWATSSRNDREMKITEQNDTPSEGDFTKLTRVFSGPKRNNLNLSRSFTGINPSRRRFRVRLAVDIANTRFTFGTETFGPQFESSGQSAALRMELSSHIKSVPELSTSATPQLDKALEAPSFWGMLWGALTSLF